jgi:hypothetical protein
LEDDTAFFTVTEGESFVNFPNLLLFPDTCIVFYVSEAFFIAMYLAKIVEEGGNGNAFVRDLIGDIFVAQMHCDVVNVQGMLAKTSGIVAVEFGACGGREEITFFKPIDKSVKSGTVDLLTADLQKSFLALCNV